MAYHSEAEEVFGNYHDLALSFGGPLPRAPSDGVPGLSRSAGDSAAGSAAEPLLDSTTREELRRLIAEELHDLLKHDLLKK